MKSAYSRIAPSLTWLGRMLFDILLVYLVYLICRIAFLIENWEFVRDDYTWRLIARMLEGGWYFDTSAILYTNVLWLLIILLPWHIKERAKVQSVAKWIFVAVNSLAVVLNLTDCIYYQYTQRRTTLTIFREFGDNTNFGPVVGAELVNHWYLVLLAAVLIWGMIRLYRKPEWPTGKFSLKRYYITRAVALALAVPVIICGMRGYLFFTSSRPIAMANAHQWVDTPAQTGIVLNTPFAMIRTVKGSKVNIPRFFDTDAEVEQWYTAVHYPPTDAQFNGKNVVILIVESFAEEFIGARTRGLDGGQYRGYTPFADELISRSTTWEQSFCNGWVSIDAMPAVLSSIPKISNSFILSPYSLNDVPGIAKELKTKGYETAFFHGAENSSMGFQAFAHSAGFDKYLGRTEYDADPRFGGEADFDGTWAIWDEEFLQFFCTKLSEMKQPFLGAVFTASSHHPFHIPDRYRDTFPDEGIYPMHKCIRYADHSLRRFFEEASRQPWYNNTIFVLCADHASSKTTHTEYKTELGHFRIPIIIFDPSGSLPVGVQPGVAQQIDIMPTLLGILGYDKPYIAFGTDLLKRPASQSWAFNWHNTPQVISDSLLVQFNNFAPTGIYAYHTDPLLQHNLAPVPGASAPAIVPGASASVDTLTLRFKAFLQTYDRLMKSNSLRIK